MNKSLVNYVVKKQCDLSVHSSSFIINSTKSTDKFVKIETVTKKPSIVVYSDSHGRNLII